MIFYHGSPLAGITELGTRSVTHDQAKASVVYLTPNRAYALFYIRDLDVNYVTCGVTADGFIRYDERFPEQLRTVYKGKSGYLYHCAVGDGLEETSTRDVWVSHSPVPVGYTEFIPDVYEEILKYEETGQVKVMRYETLTAEQKQDVRDMILHSVYKYISKKTISKKAAFYKEHFQAEWNYALSHPEEEEDGLL